MAHQDMSASGVLEVTSDAAPEGAKPASLVEGARRELAALHRLIDAARLVIADADWEATGCEERPQARVPKHHLVLVEAALRELDADPAATPDGYPHAGADVAAGGVCDAGFCPCHDARRAPQPALLGEPAGR